MRRYVINTEIEFESFRIWLCSQILCSCRKGFFKETIIVEIDKMREEDLQHLLNRNGINFEKQ